MHEYVLSELAQEDLWEIWCHIAEDSPSLADRIENDFHKLFRSLAQMPTQGHKRLDLTSRPVLFMPLYSFLVIYQPEVQPLRILASLRGKRNVAGILSERL